MARVPIVLIACLLGVGVGCKEDDDLPPTVIDKPRVLVITAEPPSVPPGGSTTVTAVVVGTDEAPVVSWTRCRRPPQPGDAVNPDCVEVAEADYLEPLGDGDTITTTMPDDVTPAALGQPDASGGVYLTLVARVSVAGETLLATYRLRLGSATDANQNPILTGITVIDAGGGTSPLDEASPPVVHAGDQVTLQAAVAAGSVESYPAALDGAATLEVLRTSWFATAGMFSKERTDGPEATTVLELVDPLPVGGTTIDLYAVTRDDRGGAAYIHRALTFE